MQALSSMQVYVESILALQKKACEHQGKAVELELVIMTSDDTHSRTQQLLDDHTYFGMERHQLHLLKQEKVIVLMPLIHCPCTFRLYDWGCTCICHVPCTCGPMMCLLRSGGTCVLDNDSRN